jgi:hypothetical protein
MSTEVHIFLATATASGAERWPVSELHAMHIYLRQPQGSEHNWEAVVLVAMKSGWSNVEIKKAGTLPANTADKKREPEPGRGCIAPLFDVQPHWKY